MVTARESEDQSLADIRKLLRPGDYAEVGSGDDAAVVTTEAGRFVVTTDTMVENHDFRHDWSTAYDLGFKAVATNLADVAAMGAKPSALVVALVVSGAEPASWQLDFARGLQAACDQLAPGVGVVGGDLAAGDQTVIAVTAHGDLEGRPPVLRSGAKPGDRVAVAGTLGRAACGLALLSHPNPELAAAWDEFVAVQLRPEPPIALGAAAALAGATAMLDVSDSLAKDANRIALAAGVSLELKSAALEGYLAVLEGPAASLRARSDSVENYERDWVLYGGEDHALLACFSPAATLPRGFKEIGTVVEAGAHPVSLDGQLLEPRGWDSLTGAGQ
jgi:thiamine-monophosphate kinase